MTAIKNKHSKKSPAGESAFSPGAVFSVGVGAVNTDPAGASFMIDDKDREDIYVFVTNLNDRHLKDLFRAARRELKKRNLLEPNEINFKAENKLSTFICLNRKDMENDGLIVKTRGNPIVKMGNYQLKNKQIRECIIDFLLEDWSFLFPNTDNVKKDYYVYFHSDPTEPGVSFIKNNIQFYMYGKPFYVGKGKGDRYKSMYGRCTAHQNKVKDLILHGVEKEKIFNILQDNLTELEAFELESKLITYFGTAGEYGNDRPYFTKYKGGILLNSDVTKRPDWINEVIHHISSKYHAAKKESYKRKVAKMNLEV